MLGLEAYFVDDRTVREGKVERNHLTLLAADRRGLQEPHQALQQGLPRGPAPRQAGRRPRAARPARRGRHLPHRLPRRRARASGSSTGQLDEARAHLDELVQVFGPEDVYLEVQKQRPRRAGAGQRGDRERFAAGDGPPAGRHGRRALPAPGGLPPPRGAAVRADEVDARARRRCRFDTNEFYLKSLGGDGGVVRRRSRARSSRRWRSPSAATSTIALGGQLIPRFDCPDGARREGVPARAGRGGPAPSATATRRPPRPSSAWRWSSASSTRWASTPTS